jgi:hypothetical protein
VTSHSSGHFQLIQHLIHQYKHYNDKSSVHELIAATLDAL